jgi:hypothetical protein
MKPAFVHNFLLVLFLLLAASSCRNDGEEPAPEVKSGCELLNITRDGLLRWSLEYNNKGEIIRDEGERSYHQFTYTYDDQGYLRKAVSKLEDKETRSYEYKNGLLSKITLSFYLIETKLVETRFIYYFEYDANRNLDKVITQRITGISYLDQTCTIKYKNDLPVSLVVKNIEGESQPYVFEGGKVIRHNGTNGDFILYEYDSQGRLTKLSSYRANNSLMYYITATFYDGKGESEAFPGFKGFPKIINNRFQSNKLINRNPSGGITLSELTKTEVSYDLRGGVMTKTAEVNNTYTFNSNGFPTRKITAAGNLLPSGWEDLEIYTTVYAYRNCD